MSDKNQRHQAIREIVTARAVASQEELRRLLVRRGWDVTQSTLSRDLRELRLARIPDEQGDVRYSFPENGHSEDPNRQLEALLPSLLVGAEACRCLLSPGPSHQARSQLLPRSTTPAGQKWPVQSQVMTPCS